MIKILLHTDTRLSEQLKKEEYFLDHLFLNIVTFLHICTQVSFLNIETKFSCSPLSLKGIHKLSLLKVIPKFLWKERAAHGFHGVCFNDILIIWQMIELALSKHLGREIINQTKVEALICLNRKCWILLYLEYPDV